MNKQPICQENLLLSLTKRSLSVLLEQLDESAITDEIRHVNANISTKDSSHNEDTDRIPEYSIINKTTPIELRVWCPVMCRLDGECCLAGRIFVNDEWVLYRTNYIKSVTKNRRLICDDDGNWFRLCGGLIPQTQDELYAMDHTIPLVHFDWKIVDAFSEGFPDNFRIWIQQVAVADQSERKRKCDPEEKTSTKKPNCDLDDSAASSQSDLSNDEHDSLLETQVSESFADFDANEDPVKYVDRLLANNPYKEIFRDRMIVRVVSHKMRLLSKMDSCVNVEPSHKEDDATPEMETVEPPVAKESQSDRKSRRQRSQEKRRSSNERSQEESPSRTTGRLTGTPVVLNPRRQLKEKDSNSKMAEKPKSKAKVAERERQELAVEPTVSKESRGGRKSRRVRSQEKRRSSNDEGHEESPSSAAGRLTGTPVILNPRRQLKEKDSNSKMAAKPKSKSKAKVPERECQELAAESPVTKESQGGRKSRRERSQQKRSSNDEGHEESPSSAVGRLTGTPVVLNPRRQLKEKDSNSKMAAKSKSKAKATVPERECQEESNKERMSGVSVHDFSPQDADWSPYCLRTISGSNVDVRNLPRSRSGRIIKPILDNFRGQYITIKDGEVAEIHHGKEDLVYNLKMFSAEKTRGRPKRNRQPKLRFQPSSVHGSGKRKLFSVNASPPLPSSSFNDSYVARKKSRILKSENDDPTEHYRNCIAKA